MEWLNYHHLHYFWAVAREGGITPASKILRLSHPTLSTQIKVLEESLGEKLFEKRGRRLVLTAMGLTVYRYAEDIFSLGRELLDTVHNRSTNRKIKLSVGIVQVVPKLIAKRLLDSALSNQQDLILQCREDKIEQLTSDLGNHQIDAIISDAPLAPDSPIKAYSHFLGSSTISFFGASSINKKRKFLSQLAELPMLLPMPSSALRRALDLWFVTQSISPKIEAEFDDSALMKVFGQDGVGIFPSVTAIKKEICSQYHVQAIGQIPSIIEKFYIITPERKIKHPALISLYEKAHSAIFKN